MKAPRDLVFLEALDAVFTASVAVERARIDLQVATDGRVPTRIAGATRRLQNAVTHARQLRAVFDAQLSDAAKESA